MKVKAITSIAIFASLLVAAPAWAHVIVTPGSVGVAQRQDFTVSVPNEKDIATTGLRLVIPTGLQDVSPIVKPGWTMAEKKDGDNITEISWTGGSIPAGQTDLFVINAQAPDKTTTMAWKAYQTYADGSIVSWDETPGTKPPAGQDELTPYSETKVTYDLAQSTPDRTPLYLSIVAVVIAGAALLRPKR